MTRTLKNLMAIGLGTLLLSGAACEDKEAQEALKTCKNDLGNVQKSLTSQNVALDEIKAQLAQAQAKVQELTKESDAAKTGKNGKTAEEKPKIGDAKKPEVAKKDAKK